MHILQGVSKHHNLDHSLTLKLFFIDFSGVFTRAEAMSNPSGLLNSIDASFQMRLQELEEKQGVQLLIMD